MRIDQKFYLSRKWQELLIEYNLEENQWMENLFRLRKKWAAVYRASFTADMNSTQRSEGTPLQLSSSEIPATDEGTPERKINKGTTVIPITDYKFCGDVQRPSGCNPRCVCQEHRRRDETLCYPTIALFNNSIS